MEGKVYVAVGDNAKDSKSILIWAIQNSRGSQTCLLHVHQPAQLIPMLGGKFPASSMKEVEVRAYREIEKQKKQKILNGYIQLCYKMGVRPELMHVDMDCIEKGIVELISKHGIKRLVMGAAADKHYSRKMMELRSPKAIYVRQHASPFCHIQFVCKGCLIHTREAILNAAEVEVRPSQNAEIGSPNYMGAESRWQNIGPTPSNSERLSFGSERSFSTDHSVGRQTNVSTHDVTEELSTPSRRLDVRGDSDVESQGRSSPGSSYSTCFSTREPDIARIPSLRSEASDYLFQLSAAPRSRDNLYPSPSPSLLDGSIDDNLYVQLERAMAEAEDARREAFQEAERCSKIRKEVIEAMRRAQISESLYAEEVKIRKEAEEALATEVEEHQNMEERLNQVTEELRTALDKQSSLESQLAESEETVKGLELRLVSALELLETYKKERDEFQTEREIAQKEAEELRRKQGEASHTKKPLSFAEISFSEIEEATRNFDPSLEIREGRYGRIYKGFWRQTEVAIEMLHHDNLPEPLAFEHEVDTLSKLRHPNLVALIGSCKDADALVYEYLPNGTLEDRLSYKDNSAPLSWQTRICIATEICSALIFLHSHTPASILHGDLTPSKVLLDANFISKLCDFGYCPGPSSDQSLEDNTTVYWRTEPKGTSFPYLDPEFLFTGELTLESDVYSFGIILLQLLTGRPPLGIKKDVQLALDAGKFETLLDPLAGDWPFELAQPLASMALRCCDMYRTNRANLVSDVWTVLEPMSASLGGSYSFHLISEEHFEPPPYFLCPISQEVMQDPQVAADGFTYDAEVLRQWFDSGHETSPMTNLKLEHFNLVPNHALRSAIQEWRQRIEIDPFSFSH